METEDAFDGTLSSVSTRVACVTWGTMCGFGRAKPRTNGAEKNLRLGRGAMHIRAAQGARCALRCAC